MPNLFSTMRSAATALDTLQKAALNAQNNVSNASTPGYAKQQTSMSALSFDPDKGSDRRCEVRAESVVSRRVCGAVRSRTVQLRSASQEKAVQLAAVEGNFDLNDVTGVASRLNSLFAAFNSWSVAPLNQSEKDNVLAAASDVAGAFNQAANSLKSSAQNAEVRIGTTFTKIDDIAERIRNHNIAVRNGDANNAGADATMHSDLEELAAYVNFQALWQTDGTVTILIGNQTSLVTGDQKFGFTVTPDPTAPPAALAGATPKLQVMDHNGFNVTATMTGGQLGALLDVRNNVIPSLAGSVTDAGDLNRMAQGFADRVNQILTAGDSNPATAIPLFTYTNLGGAASP